MEHLSYYIEKIEIDRWHSENSPDHKNEIIDIWRQTDRGKFLSKYQMFEITSHHDVARYCTVLVIKFAMSPQQVTFFNLKFGK